MHRSRLSSLIIDCKSDDLEAAARFWSAAIGRPIVAPTGENYLELETTGDELIIEVQKVDHESRVHLDIETDDVEAEVARLEALGAKKVAYVKRWWVMEAPTGQRFCVLKPQRGSLDTDANDWP
jgi:hypothetical protein